MKHPLLRPLTTHARSLLLSVQYRFGLAIALSALLLWSSGLLLPFRALAQPPALTSASRIVGSRTIVANQPIISATSKMSAIVVNRLRQDLSQRTNIPTAQLKLIETMPKTWNDGCFGLARPDEFCTQALIEGWRVVFSHGSERWVYRTDMRGRSYRLEP